MLRKWCWCDRHLANQRTGAADLWRPPEHLQIHVPVYCCSARWHEPKARGRKVDQGHQHSDCYSRPTFGSYAKYQGLHLPQFGEFDHWWGRSYFGSWIWGGDEYDHQTSTQEKANFLVLSDSDQKGSWLGPLIPQQTCLRGSEDQRQCLHGVWLDARLCGLPGWKPVFAFVHLSEEEQGQESHGLHVCLQCSQAAWKHFSYADAANFVWNDVSYLWRFQSGSMMSSWITSIFLWTASMAIRSSKPGLLRLLSILWCLYLFVLFAMSMAPKLTNMGSHEPYCKSQPDLQGTISSAVRIRGFWYVPM